MGINWVKYSKENTQERCIKISITNKQLIFEINPAYLTK